MLDGLMPYLQQVEAQDTEGCDMAELGLWNGAKPGAQKAPAPGKSTLAAKGSIHIGATSGTKAGPTLSIPEVGLLQPTWSNAYLCRQIARWGQDTFAWLAKDLT